VPVPDEKKKLWQKGYRRCLADCVKTAKKAGASDAVLAALQATPFPFAAKPEPKPKKKRGALDIFLDAGKINGDQTVSNYGAN
jgi:hypothetical protein